MSTHTNYVFGKHVCGAAGGTKRLLSVDLPPLSRTLLGGWWVLMSEKGEVLLRGVGTPRYFAHPQWQLCLSSAHLCSGSLMVWNSTPKMVPRSRISRSISHFSYDGWLKVQGVGEGVALKWEASRGSLGRPIRLHHAHLPTLTCSLALQWFNFVDPKWPKKVTETGGLRVVPGGLKVVPV